jgi:hypothetical protein
MSAPETVEIDALSRYYEPVEFDHQLHVDVAEDCSVCHHLSLPKTLSAHWGDEQRG